MLAIGNCQVSDQIIILSRATVKSWLWFISRYELYNFKSSAKSLIVHSRLFTTDDKSFINNKNKVGPSTLPWGTPLTILIGSDKALLIFTCWDLSVRNAVIHFKRLPRILYNESLNNNFECDTESNAFWKLIYITSVIRWLSSAVLQSLVDSKRFVHVERLLRKPCWLGDIMLYLFRYSTICELIIFSMIRQQVQVKEMGL